MQPEMSALGQKRTSAKVDVYYCDSAGVPTIVGETRAWLFMHGTINRTEAYTKARLIGDVPFETSYAISVAIGCKADMRWCTVYDR